MKGKKANTTSIHLLSKSVKLIYLKLAITHIPSAPAAVPWPLCSQQMVASGWLPSPQCQQAILTNHPMLLGTFLTAEDLHLACGLVRSTGHRGEYKMIVIHNKYTWLHYENIMVKMKWHNLREELKKKYSSTVHNAKLWFIHATYYWYGCEKLGAYYGLNT